MAIIITNHQVAGKVPIEGARNVLITSALPYVNNVPHLGNSIGSVLSADVYARDCSSRGYNVLYVCGTDEYGTTTEVRAEQEGLSFIEICDKYHSLHKDVYNWFEISFDEFGRTSSPEHTEICHAVFEKLFDNGCFDQKLCEQLYCENCSKFLADSLVEGECPHCSCICKGDQCEQCGAHLNARDLVHPVCKICHNSQPVYRESDHLFLKQSKAQEELCQRHSNISISNPDGKALTRKSLSEPLPDKCITRDLKWGVPVPRVDLPDKVLYVWFDAPLGYVSITKCHTPNWELWWKDPSKNVELHQFMGKDNVPFHTVLFPSILLGTGNKWTLPTAIHATQFLNYKTGKFSNSNGVGIFGDHAKDTGIPVEVWRYYLLSVRPEESDSVFCWKDPQAKLNAELADNLGNFVNRVISIVAMTPVKNAELADNLGNFVNRVISIVAMTPGCGGIIPDAQTAKLEDSELDFAATISGLVKNYLDAMEKAELKSGLRAAMKIVREGNKYFQKEKVWELSSVNNSKFSIVIKTSVGVVCILGCLLEPFMPSFAREVSTQLNLGPWDIVSLLDENTGKSQSEFECKRPWDIVPAGHEIGTKKPIFTKMTDDKLKTLDEKFSGNRAADSKKPKSKKKNTASFAKQKLVDS